MKQVHSENNESMDQILSSNQHACPDCDDVTSQELMRRIDSIHELPTLSVVAMQVSSMLQDINTSAQDLSKVIENDQAIVPKMLKLVNSAFFGFSQKVTSVPHALMLLGFNTVRNAVLSIEVINAVELKNKIAGFDITQFWQHAISVAVISRHLDQMMGGANREDVFAAGLIHDIGKIVMARYFPSNFEATWYSMQQSGLSFWDAEKKHFPVHHAAIGAQLAKRWNLPDELRRVISQHHANRKKAAGELLPLIVHTADALFYQYMEQNRMSDFPPICMGARQALAKPLAETDKWMPELKDEIKSACRSLLEE